jgi:4-hydroxy-tetrahydrodipicolinate synthase
MFKGSIVALITPFLNDKLDEDNYIRLIHHHIDSGTNGIVPAGTTGESPTLSHDEHRKVIELAINECNGKIPVIAGTGSNSTAEAIELSKHAEKAGSDGLLIVTPYYNKPTQEGLFQHYKKINDNVGIPIIIYNIPSRSVIDMSVETMSRLFELKNIVGVKDATGDLKRVDQQLKAMGKEFTQLTGEDDNALEFNKKGGVGCISVTANVAAKLCAKFQSATLDKENDKMKSKAKEINNLLSPLHKALFIESNPSPVKYAASLLNLSNDDVRLPLVKLMDKTKIEVKKALEFANLL